jgi:hypothetical protein
VFGWAIVAEATPVDFGQVPANAKWFAHLDVDAMKRSTVVDRACREIAKTRPALKPALATIRELGGIDLVHELQSVTFFGEQIKEGAGVVLVRATMDQDVMLRRAQREPDFRTSTYGSHRVYSWTGRKWSPAKGTHGEATMAGAFHGSTLLVLGSTTDQVMAALDLLDGQLANLAGSDGPLAAAVPPGTALVARAVNLADSGAPVKSPLVKQIKSLDLVVGQHEDQVFARLAVDVGTSSMADQTAKVVEGLRAMASLKVVDQPELNEMIGAVDVATDGATVTIGLETSSDEMWQNIEFLRGVVAESDQGNR